MAVIYICMKDSETKEKTVWRGICFKGYLVLIEREGVEVGQPGQAEVVSKQIVVDHQLLQLGEQSEAC